MAHLINQFPGRLMIDVGCDHGYLGIAALQAKSVTFVLNIDDKLAPLAVAKGNAQRAGLNGHIFCLQSDGLKRVPHTLAPAWIVVTGLGFIKIASILAADQVGTKNTKYLLQAQENPDGLEQWLILHGFNLLRIDELWYKQRAYRFVVAQRYLVDS